MTDNEQPTTTETPTQSLPETSLDKSTDTGADVEKPIMNSAELKERLARHERSLLSKLGDVSDLAAAQKLIAEAKKISDEKLTESERTTKALAEAEKKAADAQAKIAELELKSKVKDFKDAIRKQASALNAKYPDDVITAVETSPEFAKWLEADAPDEKKIKAWVEEYKKQRPDYFTSGNGTPGSPSNRNAGGVATGDEQQKLLERLRQQTRKGF